MLSPYYYYIYISLFFLLLSLLSCAFLLSCFFLILVFSLSHSLFISSLLSSFTLYSFLCFFLLSFYVLSLLLFMCCPFPFIASSARCAIGSIFPRLSSARMVYFCRMFVCL